MTYRDKREFAARVFTAVLERYSYVAGHDDDCDKAAVLLAQAQLEALTSEDTAAMLDKGGGDLFGRLRSKANSEYDLALQLAPLVGVEVNLG